jgi:tetratricopeptide (TPR) repeat protein
MEELTTIDEARSDLLACAIYLSGNINSHEAQAEALRPIVLRCLEKNDVDNAAHFADTVNDSFVRNRLLVSVIAKCVELEDDEYAFQLVEAIDDRGMQATAREVIAKQRSVRGDFDGAVAIAETLEHSSDTFAAIAVNQAKKGFEAEALETLERIDFNKSKVAALEATAAYFLEEKQTEQAVRFIEKALAEAAGIEFAEDMVRSYFEIGNLFIGAGKKDRAIDTFAKAAAAIGALEGVHRDGLYANTAIGYFNAGSLDLADRTLDEVFDKTQVANCLLGFSQIFFREDEKEESLDALEEAYAILKSQHETEIRDSKARNQLFANIAVQFARLEKIERAVEIAHENIDEMQTNLALTNIAQLCVLQGNDELAGETIRGIESDAQRLSALVGLSDAKNQTEQKADAVVFLDEAAALIETVPQYIVRSDTQNEIAKRYLLYGETEKARRTASESLVTIGQINGVNNRSIALTNLSEVFEKGGFTLSESDREILENLIRKSEF